MPDAYRTNWSFGGETLDPRNRFHETALCEARIASEYQLMKAAAPAKAGLLTRIRLAFARPSTTEACNCPA